MQFGSLSLLADTIRNITAAHLRNGGVFLCQNATDNGYVQNTVPHDDDILDKIITLPTSDVSNSGIVCGFALAGNRPIYGIRYQGFSWLNNSNLVNYAAKSKQLWGAPCPIFVRAVGMEGAIGPTASHMHHSAVCRMPGIKVFAPMTPTEYELTWQEFMNGDDPVFCSEHRLSYSNENELRNSFCCVARQPTIIAIGAARFNALRAVGELKSRGIFVNLVHLWQLKPLVLPDSIGIATSKILVVDSDYSFGGFGNEVAMECLRRYKIADIDVIGLEDRVAGFSTDTDVLIPSVERIVNYFV